MKLLLRKYMLQIIAVSLALQVILTVIMPGMMDWRHSVLCGGIIFILFTINVITVLVNIVVLLTNINTKMKSLVPNINSVFDEPNKPNVTVKVKEENVPEIFEPATAEEINRISK